MKIAILLSVLGFALSVFAQASLSAELEVVYYWYAYQLENEEAVDKTTKVLAPDCSGTAFLLTCYFDEFVKYIQADNAQYIPWEGPSGVGTNLTPDPVSAAQALKNAGFSGKVNPHALVPSKFSAGTSVSFTDLLGAINDSIAGSRSAAATAGIDITSDVTRLQNTMVSVANYRLQDQGSATTDAFVDWCTIKKCEFSLMVKTVVNADGSVYTKLDTDSMLKDAPTLRDKIMEGIRLFVADYNSKGTWPTSTVPAALGRSRFLAIQSSQGAASELARALPCT